MKTKDEQLRKSLIRVISILGGGDDITSIIKMLDFNNPTNDVFDKISNWMLKMTDITKDQIVELKERLDRIY